MLETDNISFIPGLPFHEMISSFMTSLSTVAILMNKEMLPDIKKKDYISFDGVWVNGHHFFASDVVRNIHSGVFSFSNYMKSCCCMLANTAYESVKYKNDKSSEFELLRHVRNASSHQNIFNFYREEPIRSASWRGATIDHRRKGKENSLYGQECFGTFMQVADIIFCFTILKPSWQGKKENLLLNFSLTNNAKEWCTTHD